MEKKVNLRAGTVRAVPADGPTPKHIDMPGFKGTLPFNAGVIRKDNSTLSKDVLAEDQAARNAPIITPENEKRKAIKPQAPVNIDELPEARQKELLESVTKATERPVKESVFIARGPGIAEAKALADKIANDTEKKLRDEVVTPPTAAQEDTPIPPQAAISSTQNCIHCGWQVGSLNACEPDRADKQMFVAAVLGQMRFTKQYSLLGGQMHVTFRSLTVEENDLVVRQLMQDWNDGKLSGSNHSIIEATKYQLALSLASIETNVGVITMPVFDEYDTDEPTKGTALPQIVEHVNKTAMPNEHTRRIVSKAYGHFVETQSRLEAMSETPDFWQATGD